MEQNTQQQQQQTDLTAYNEAVQDAFFNVIENVRHWLSKIKHPTFRQTFVNDAPKDLKPGTTVYNLLHALIFLRLVCLENGEYAIQFGFETYDIYPECKPVIGVMLRSLYTQTARNNTVIDIERSILFDCCLNATIEAFTEQQSNPTLTCEMIPYIG